MTWIEILTIVNTLTILSAAVAYFVVRARRRRLFKSVRFPAMSAGYKCELEPPGKDEIGQKYQRVVRMYPYDSISPVREKGQDK